MSTLLDMLLNRRSVRSYTGEEIPEEKNEACSSGRSVI